jgi:hypothetical protein
MSVYELPPGEAIGPYHYEDPEEEWLLVLDGRPTLRNPQGDDELPTWDAVFFPPGDELEPPRYLISDRFTLVCGSPAGRERGRASGVIRSSAARPRWSAGPRE